MSTTEAVFSGWMEIPESAVQERARSHADQPRADEDILAALVSQYAATLYRVAFSF